MLLTKMVNEQELIDQFKIGLAISLDKQVLDKCVNLCSKYGISEEDFVNDWIAFSLSNSLDSEPTIPALTLLERKQLSSTLSHTPAKKIESKTYSPKVQKVISSDDIVQSYFQNKTPQRNVETINKRQLVSPQEDSTKRRQISNLNQSQFASVSFNSDASERSTKYNERTDSETVQISFGGEELLKKASWKGKGVLDVNIKLLKQLDSYRYMQDEVVENIGVEVETTNRLTFQILMKNELNSANKIDEVLVDEGVFCGRLRKVLPRGEFDEKVDLESHMPGSTFGKRISLNFKNMQEYCLYPGQVVCFSGINPSGKKIYPTKCFTDAPPRLPDTKLTFNEGSSLQIVIASGPYTLNDNIEYEPLNDFVTYIVRNKPDVVIMIGPFVDDKHERIADGMLAETFNELFERLIAGVMEPLAQLQTHVILIPSYQDAHHSPVYPTPPYKLRQHYPRLHLCTDPCQININGLIVAATSLDVIKHISSIELCKPMASDRIKRVATHLLSQRSIYPLSRETSEVPLDSQFWKQLTHLDVVPHLMILPSKLKYFIKDIGECIIINPEILGKGCKGGTFGRIEILNKNNSITSNILGQIIKI